MEAICLKTHEMLIEKSYTTWQEADTICNTYEGFAWIKDSNCAFLQSNKNFAEFLGLSSPEMIVGKTDLDFQFASTGHTGNDFRLIDQCVLRGVEYHKKIELAITSGGSPLLVLVTKVCILSDDHKSVAVLGIALPLTPEQTLKLNGMATLAPICSWSAELTPFPLTDTEHHIQIMHNKLKLSNKEIAKIRNISIRTVDTHLYNIRAKLYGNTHHHSNLREKSSTLPKS